MQDVLNGSVRAAVLLQVRLEDRRMWSMTRRFRRILAVTATAVGADGHSFVPGLDLVAVRRTDGTEVFRVHAGKGAEAAEVLRSASADLHRVTALEFIVAWGQSFDRLPTMRRRDSDRDDQ